MIRTAITAMLAASALLAGCQASEGASSTEGTSAAEAYPSGPVTMTAGATPGSGFDLTIRSVVEALQKEHIVDVPLPVQNRPGASGADFLATMVNQYRGEDDQISVTSLSMMMNQLRGVSNYGYQDVTMIARVMTEYFVVVTTPNSPFKNLNDLMAAIKSDPGSVTVGAAHDDEGPFDLLVSAAGGDPRSVTYVTHEGGGDQSTALRNGEIDRGDRRCQRVHRPGEVSRAEGTRCAGRAAVARSGRSHRHRAGARRHALELAWHLRAAGHAATSRLRTGRGRSARWCRRRPGRRSRSEASSPRPS